MNHILLRRYGLLALLLTAPGALQAQSFEGLGDLGGGAVSSEARAVSADGRVVVGSSASGTGTQAFRWENGAIQVVGGNASSVAFAVNADGGVVVGRAQFGSTNQAFRWAGGTNESLGGLTGPLGTSAAQAVSADGSIVFGFSQSNQGLEAFRWQNGLMSSLGDLPGAATNSRVNATTPGGTVAVGRGIGTGGRFAVVFSGGAVSALPDLDGGPPDGEAFGVSEDGTVVVGYGFSGEGRRAVRWVDGVIEELTGPPGTTESTATSVSADGLVVVGSVTVGTAASAFVWTEENGMRLLKALLLEQEIDEVGAWGLTEATGVSADGGVIVGRGVNPDGEAEAWRAVLVPTDIYVTTTGDEPNDAASAADDVCDVDLAEDGDQCTLRAALQLATARSGGTILFDIETDGVPLISPMTALPDITEAVVIDGTTQAAGRVHLDGAASAPADGLRATGGDGLVVRGLVVTAFARFGIRLAGGSGHKIENTYVGYMPNGETAAPNLVGGVRVEAGTLDSQIGGRTEATENRIYGGVSIVDAATRGIAVLRNRLEVPADWLGAQIVRVPIDLDDSGPTCAAWSGSNASGPNLAMPAPHLLEVAPTVIRGRTQPGATVVIYRVDDAGTERARYWPRRVVPVAVADADGNGAFSAVPDGPLALESVVTATATDGAGNTSELAQLRRPVIFLPGVGGTWLVADTDDKTLWVPTLFTNDEGANDALARMALTDEGLPRGEEPVRTQGLLESYLTRDLPYKHAVEHIQDAGYPGDRENSARATNDLWRFPNDWRLTATGLAAELQTLVQDLTDGGETVARSCQVDLVAHSNGGVIASIYLLGLGADEAASRVHRVLTSGTPYLGAVQPAAAHTSGYLFEIDESTPGLDLDWGRMIRMVRSLPGAYALMPSDIYWAADRGLSGLSTPRFVLEDLNGEPLESNPATIDFLTRAKEVDGQPSGLDRLGDLWAQERSTVQAVIGDWRTYEGPPQIFRHVGNVEGSTAIAFFLPDPPADLPEGATNRSEEGDTDRHRGYREGLSPWRSFGDGTVPLVSATLGWDTRVGGEDYSGVDLPWVEPFEEYPCLHVDLVGTECAANGQTALDRIVEVLKGGYSVVPAASGRGGSAAAPRELIYVWADAPVRVWLTDDQGRTTGPASTDEPNRVLYDVPGVVYDATLLGASLSVPADRVYTVRAETVGSATVRVARQRVAAGDEERVHVLFGDAVVAAGGGVRLTLSEAGTPASTALALDADGDGTYEGTMAPGLEVTNASGMIPVPVPRPSAVTLSVPTGQTATVDLDFPDVSADGWSWSLAEDIPWLTPAATSGSTPGSVTLSVDASALSVGTLDATMTATLGNGAFERVVRLLVRLTVNPPVAGEAPPVIPTATRLLPPAPNPTRGRATITAELSEAGPLSIDVIDTLGRVVMRLASGPHPAGTHRFRVDAAALPAGIYAIRMRFGAGVATGRLTVVR